MQDTDLDANAGLLLLHRTRGTLRSVGQKGRVLQRAARWAPHEYDWCAKAATAGGWSLSILDSWFFAGELGGVTVGSYSEACTHVVGTHQMQECCIAATRAGQHVVNIDWAAECQSKGVLLPTELAVGHPQLISAFTLALDGQHHHCHHHRHPHEQVHAIPHRTASHRSASVIPATHLLQEYRVLPGPAIPGFKEAVRRMTFTNIEVSCAAYSRPPPTQASYTRPALDMCVPTRVAWPTHCLSPPQLHGMQTSASGLGCVSTCGFGSYGCKVCVASAQHTESRRSALSSSSAYASAATMAVPAAAAVASSSSSSQYFAGVCCHRLLTQPTLARANVGTAAVAGHRAGQGGVLDAGHGGCLQQQPGQARHPPAAHQPRRHRPQGGLRQVLPSPSSSARSSRSWICSVESPPRWCLYCRLRFGWLWGSIAFASRGVEMKRQSASACHISR
jgi:hypothetical protein